MALPCPSVIVMIVLLNAAFTLGDAQVTTFFFSFERARAAARVSPFRPLRRRSPRRAGPFRACI